MRTMLDGEECSTGSADRAGYDNVEGAEGNEI
jgi:hypothetical protein